MTTQTRFRYSLAALESLYMHRLDQARLALAQAQRQLDAHQDLLHGLRLAMARHHTDWVAASAVAGGFDPARHEVVRAALSVMQARLDAAGAHEAALIKAVQACRDHVLRAHRRNDTLDRHKRDATREFQLESARSDQRQADDAWPLQGGRHDRI
ncbi:hypothetical protein [Achromobacter xylosoxidans]|uniref:hypothetical protein n=1 Tax=Alcaligenes xylosoxydans xylosoxydans TaxID=85698 RepID=UPI0006C8D0CB|nr:hypothetical protein [Achromobacter xylosoxidans]